MCHLLSKLDFLSYYHSFLSVHLAFDVPVLSNYHINFYYLLLWISYILIYLILDLNLIIDWILVLFVLYFYEIFLLFARLSYLQICTASN